MPATVSVSFEAQDTGGDTQAGHMGHSFAIAVTLPAWMAAIVALFMGASWLMAFAILMGVTALGGLGLAGLVLAGDAAEQDGLAPRAT